MSVDVTHSRQGTLVEADEQPRADRPRQSYASYARARQRRLLRRRLLRGGIGLFVALLLWQLASASAHLELILPTPVAVLTNVVRTLLLQQEKWLYGPNIYEHLRMSLWRA